MLNVLILKSWNYPPLFRQSPGGKGIWKNIQYTFDLNSNYDYVLSLDTIKTNLTLNTYRENIWKIIQEPPNEYFKNLYKDKKIYSSIFTPDPALTNGNVINTQPAIPWFINLSYDKLSHLPINKKYLKLSCVTSSKSIFLGHRQRTEFIKQLKNEINFDLISTYDYHHRQNPKLSFKEFKLSQKKLGFNKTVQEKWQGLAPYKYSLVIENFSGPDYWSEKLSDCFLARTMPIYYGATNIYKYFPRKSLININLNDKNSLQLIKKIINSDLWIKNQQEIEKARNLILNKYQFFPFFTDAINQWETKYKAVNRDKVQITFKKEDTFYNRLKNGITARLFSYKKQYLDTS